MPSMTDSQFKTFRADVRREVHVIAGEIRGEIQNEVFQGVVQEARVMAAQVVRKDLPQRVREEVQQALDERRTQTGPKVTVTIEPDQESLDRLETLEATVTAQQGLIGRLMESREAQSKLIEDLRRTSSKAWEDMNGRIVELGKRVSPPEADIYSMGPTPTPSGLGTAYDGMTCLHNGEMFYFWWGQWRRESEVRSFASAVKAFGL